MKPGKKRVFESKTHRARRLRREMTYPEKKLWWSLRNRQLARLKFRRQHPIGDYFADFCCEEKMLVIEVDGDSHEGQYVYDTHREQFIKRVTAIR